MAPAVAIRAAGIDSAGLRFTAEGLQLEISTSPQEEYVRVGGVDITEAIREPGISAGESLAFGLGVTMPAIMILGFDLEISRVMLVAPATDAKSRTRRNARLEPMPLERFAGRAAIVTGAASGMGLATARAFAAQLVAAAQLQKASVAPGRVPLSGSLFPEKLRYRPRIYRVLALPGQQQPQWHVRVLPERVRVDGDIAMGGGGLPRANVSLRQPRQGGPMSGEARIAPYSAGGSRVARKSRSNSHVTSPGARSPSCGTTSVPERAS